MADIKTPAPKFKLTMDVLTPEQVASLPPELRAPEVVEAVEVEVEVEVVKVPTAVDHPLFHNLRHMDGFALVMFSQKPLDVPQWVKDKRKELYERVWATVGRMFTPASFADMENWGVKVLVSEPSPQYPSKDGLGMKEAAECSLAICATWPGCKVEEMWRNTERAVTFRVTGIPRN